jgi:hypothetical protein
MSDDELDDLLRLPAAPMRARSDAAFAASLRVLRWRVWRRRVVCAMLFVLGGAGLFAAGRLTAPEPERIVETVTVEVPVAVSPSVEVVADTAVKLELKAELSDSPAESAGLYKRAADLFLIERNVAAAVRCYTLFLALATPAERLAQNDDSWLLFELKAARRAANPGDLK